MSTVAKLLAAKGGDILSIPPQGTVMDAVKAMTKRSAGSLLVLDPKGKLVGIVSERDCLRKVVLKQKDPLRTTIRQIMTRKILTVKPDTSIENCMTIMTEKRIRHLPVLEKGKVVGVISIGDVVKFMASEKDFIIKNLEQYITSG